MKLAHLNLLTSLLSLAGAFLWLLFGEAPAGVLWLGISVVWLALAIIAMRSGGTEPSPVRRIARRVSRMLMYFSAL